MTYLWRTDLLSSPGHRYNIYPQPEIPSGDLYEHMLNWLDFYELLLGRDLQPDDHLFPSLSPNGTVNAHRPITAEIAQKMITDAAQAANLPRFAMFTTHCFRRGGAQYRFMYAPVGKRWTLARIRWWGGWAEGEKVCSILTLPKYAILINGSNVARHIGKVFT